VWIAEGGMLPAGGLLALYALGPCRVNERKLASEDLILTDEAVQLTTSYPVLAIRLHGVT
jgi:hypothetical protein